MNPQSIEIGSTQIRILSTVKGLVSEAKMVEDEINSFEPKLVALSVGPDEVEGTRRWDGQPYDMSGWDEIYGLSLRKLVGDDGVRLPPPSFSTAIKVSDSKNIEVIGIDMDEESFTQSYTSNISAWQLYKRARLETRMMKNGIEGNTPEEIVTNMENSIREIVGFAKLEEHRVEALYVNLVNQLDKEKILAIIDFTNVEFLKKRLMSYNPTKSKTLVMEKEQNKATKSSEKETDKDTESSVNITNIYYNIKDSVINKSDLSNKEK